MPKRLFVIDGPQAAYQAFHAIRSLANTRGEPINALFGFMAMLRKLVRDEAPEALAIAWDAPSATFRHALDPSYKATRAPMPEALAAQLPDLRALMRAHRIPWLEVPGYEADDIMATLARLGVAAGYHVALMTRDKDARQLIAPEVTLYEHREPGHFGAADLLGATGFAPAAWVEYQSLVGDSTDNIKGAPGIGPKGAEKLLARYGDVATIYAHLEEVTPPRLRTLLEQGRDSVTLARRLVTLDAHVPLDVGVEALAVVAPDHRTLNPLLARLGLGRFSVQPPSAAAVSTPSLFGEGFLP